ncbi:MAG: 30S ribosomal protein S17 [Peptostreptococcaceae bacterium]|mgnify:FL=1|jgi:30S ribosomal protein S17|nr:30S ribosomal protein S17 [Peptostreptococcaceae bacterium]
MQKNRKYEIGYVTSDKMDKTVVVSIVELVRHPLYSKAVKRTKKYKAHDEKNECKIGDRVRIGETKPLSKDKRWEVIEIVEKAAQ